MFTLLHICQPSLVFHCFSKYNSSYAIDFVLVFFSFFPASYTGHLNVSLYSLLEFKITHACVGRPETSPALPYFWDHSWMYNDTNKCKVILRRCC